MNKTIIYQAILYLHNHLYTYITISIYISIHLPIHKAIFFSIHLSIYLPLQPALSLSASLSYWSMSHYPVFIRFRLTAFLHSRAATLREKDWERERGLLGVSIDFWQWAVKSLAPHPTQNPVSAPGIIHIYRYLSSYSRISIKFPFNILM